jgi:NAD(P)-dependent dehydrogenase (short-subunit alcohol dehydrogenase family)
MGVFAGGNAVVVGCATGIGRALVDRAVTEGMSVGLVDIDAGAIEKRAASLRAAGIDAIAIACDLTQREQVEAAAAACWSHFGTLDVVFLNAGIQRQGGFLEVSLDDHLAMIDTNLRGFTVAFRSFLGPMESSGRPGRIVATASSCAVFTPKNLASYNASKGGVLNLVETVHHELESTGSKVRLSVLLPGAVNTNLHDFGRYGSIGTGPAADPVVARHESRLRHVLDRYGMDASAVAEVVFDGIAHDRFWLLSHPDIVEPVRSRFDLFFAGENPRLG